MPTVRVQGAEQFAKLARELRGPANKALRKDLGKAIRQRSTPIVRDVRAAVKAIPVTGSRGGGTAARTKHRSVTKSGKARKVRPRGLRDTVAAATGVEVRLAGASPSVRIVTRKGSMPPDQRTLPSRLNSPAGWRHPVFGNRANWVHQKGRPWFDVTIRKHAPALRRDILAAIERACATIAKDSGGR